MGYISFSTTHKESHIFTALKSLQSFLSGVLTDLPDGVRILTEFVWKCRWFLLVGWLGFLVFEMVTQILPYLMWSFIIKSVFGGLVSVFSIL